MKYGILFIFITMQQSFNKFFTTIKYPIWNYVVNRGPSVPHTRYHRYWMSNKTPAVFPLFSLFIVPAEPVRDFPETWICELSPPGLGWCTERLALNFGSLVFVCVCGVSAADVTKVRQFSDEHIKEYGVKCWTVNNESILTKFWQTHNLVF